MRSSVVCCSPSALSRAFGERFWERKIAVESAQYFSYLRVLSFQECSKKWC